MTVRETAVAVIGGGPTGLVTALALAHFGVPAVLVARGPSQIDNRTTALLGTSITALEAIGAWKPCREHAAPLRSLRIIDDTGRLWRAPQLRFDAAEIACGAFGWNIENLHLSAALWQRVAATPNHAHVDGEVAAIAIDDAGVTLALVDGSSLRCRLAVGADGRNSLCRTAAGIRVESRHYPQTALTFTLAHGRFHNDVATEFHTAQGPFTLVPLPGSRSSLVWVVAANEAERIIGLSACARDAEIERHAHSLLGKMRAEPGHSAFPLAVATAEKFGARRIGLVGEAAHLVPPIGAQGLNLGVRDAVTIAEIAAKFHRMCGDAGCDAATGAYDRLRRPDVTSRALAIDLLNRSLLSDLLPVQGLRGLGLYALDRVGPLRRAAMRAGMAPAGALPALMRNG